MQAAHEATVGRRRRQRVECHIPPLAVDGALVREWSMTQQPHIETRKAPQLSRMQVHDGGVNRRALHPLATARIESACEGVGLRLRFKSAPGAGGWGRKNARLPQPSASFRVPWQTRGYRWHTRVAARSMKRTGRSFRGARTTSTGHVHPIRCPHPSPGVSDRTTTLVSSPKMYTESTTMR